MTVCAHRLEQTGLLTPCNPCICGHEVIAAIATQDLLAEIKPNPEDQ